MDDPIRSISVTQIVLLNLDPARVLFPRRSYGSTGARIHRELGFTNQTMLQKIVDGWNVRGVPDLIGEDYVGDLKTYRTQEEKGYLIAYANMQLNIYCYIGDFDYYEITLYNIVEGRVTDVIRRRANKKQALKDIRCAIEKYKGVLKALGLYKPKGGENDGEGFLEENPEKGKKKEERSRHRRGVSSS